MESSTKKVLFWGGLIAAGTAVVYGASKATNLALDYQKMLREIELNVKFGKPEFKKSGLHLSARATINNPTDGEISFKQPVLHLGISFDDGRNIEKVTFTLPVDKRYTIKPNAINSAAGEYEIRPIPILTLINLFMRAGGKFKAQALVMGAQLVTIGKILLGKVEKTPTYAEFIEQAKLFYKKQGLTENETAAEIAEVNVKYDYGKNYPKAPSKLEQVSKIAESMFLSWKGLGVRFYYRYDLKFVFKGKEFSAPIGQKWTLATVL